MQTSNLRRFVSFEYAHIVVDFASTFSRLRVDFRSTLRRLLIHLSRVLIGHLPSDGAVSWRWDGGTGGRAVDSPRSTIARRIAQSSRHGESAAEICPVRVVRFAWHFSFVNEKSPRAFPVIRETHAGSSGYPGSTGLFGYLGDACTLAHITTDCKHFLTIPRYLFPDPPSLVRAPNCVPPAVEDAHWLRADGVKTMPAT